MTFGKEQDKQVTRLAEQIAAVLKGQDSTLALGALVSVIAPIVLNDPEQAYAIECCEFIERQAREWRQLIGSPEGHA